MIWHHSMLVHTSEAAANDGCERRLEDDINEHFAFNRLIRMQMATLEKKSTCRLQLLPVISFLVLVLTPQPKDLSSEAQGCSRVSQHHQPAAVLAERALLRGTALYVDFIYLKARLFFLWKPQMASCTPLQMSK